MPVYKISLEQVQKVSYVDQLTLLSIFNNFNMKNNFYIDSKDLLHFEKKVMDLLHFEKKKWFYIFWQSKSGFEFFMLSWPKDAMWKFETEHFGFHHTSFLVKKTHFYSN